jgi:4'-phosphopantetheinyl transferase
VSSHRDAQDGAQWPPLAPDEIHIWELSLTRSATELAALRALLSADESARAARFVFDRDRDRYTAGRGVLRLLLGRYLDRPAPSLRFDYGEFEKPFLHGGGLWFNLSNSGAMALVALSRRAELGVDLELEPVSFDVEPVARRFFSPAEVAELGALIPEQRPRGFLNTWTRKEAFIKARGDGLQLALDSFDVSLKPGLPPMLKRTAWSVEEPGQWTIRDVSDPEQGYVGAVAIRAGEIRLVRHRVPSALDRWLTTQEDR